jgi:hypothetical protein
MAGPVRADLIGTMETGTDLVRRRSGTEGVMQPFRASDLQDMAKLIDLRWVRLHSCGI